MASSGNPSEKSTAIKAPAEQQYQRRTVVKRPFFFKKSNPPTKLIHRVPPPLRTTHRGSLFIIPSSYQGGMSGLNPPRLEASSLFVEQTKKDKIRCDIYNTILGRVHLRIHATNRLPGNTQQLIYLVPEFIPGVPRFDMKECIIYLAYNLRASGFFVNYTHPNTLYISWKEQARNYRVNESPYTKTLIQVTEDAIKKQLEKQQSQELVTFDRKKSNLRKTSDYRTISGPVQNQGGMSQFIQSGSNEDTTKSVHFI